MSVPASTTQGELFDARAGRDDLIERLRREGADAFVRHYSLGMWLLCREAADRIEALEVEVARLAVERATR